MPPGGIQLVCFSLVFLMCLLIAVASSLHDDR